MLHIISLYSVYMCTCVHVCMHVRVCMCVCVCIFCIVMFEPLSALCVSFFMFFFFIADNIFHLDVHYVWP